MGTPLLRWQVCVAALLALPPSLPPSLPVHSPHSLLVGGCRLKGWMGAAAQSLPLLGPAQIPLRAEQRLVLQAQLQVRQTRAARNVGTG